MMDPVPEKLAEKAALPWKAYSQVFDPPEPVLASVPVVKVPVAPQPAPVVKKVFAPVIKVSEVEAPPVKYVEDPVPAPVVPEVKKTSAPPPVIKVQEVKALPSAPVVPEVKKSVAVPATVPKKVVPVQHAPVVKKDSVPVHTKEEEAAPTAPENPVAAPVVELPAKPVATPVPFGAFSYSYAPAEPIVQRSTSETRIGFNNWFGFYYNPILYTKAQAVASLTPKLNRIIRRMENTGSRNIYGLSTRLEWLVNDEIAKGNLPEIYAFRVGAQYFAVNNFFEWDELPPKKEGVTFMERLATKFPVGRSTKLELTALDPREDWWFVRNDPRLSAPAVPAPTVETFGGAGKNPATQESYSYQQEVLTEVGQSVPTLWEANGEAGWLVLTSCLLYTSPSPRD